MAAPASWVDMPLRAITFDCSLNRCGEPSSTRDATSMIVRRAVQVARRLKSHACPGKP